MCSPNWKLDFPHFTLRTDYELPSQSPKKNNLSKINKIYFYNPKKYLKIWLSDMLGVRNEILDKFDYQQY